MADSVKQRVYRLMEKVPPVMRHDRGDLLLVLLYWRIYDGIEIPPEVMRDLFQNATLPESITRRKRELLATYKSGGNEEVEEP